MNKSNIGILTDVRGVGRSKAEALLQVFGSLDDIKQASRDELTSVEGVGPAVAERLEDLSKTTLGGPSNTTSAKETSQGQSHANDSDSEIQELVVSLANTTSLEELDSMAQEAASKLRGDSKVAVRNPELVSTLAEIYQREENEYKKEYYDRARMLGRAARALSVSAKHKPEPVLEIIETPIRLLRNTTIPKSIRYSASSIMDTLASEHPEQLIPLLEQHHTAVSEAIEFRSPDQPDQTAAKTAADLISTYTEYRDTELFHQHVEALLRIIGRESAYISLQRIAEEHPTSVLDNAALFVDEIQRHRPDAKSNLKGNRSADVLKIASRSISTASEQWMNDIDLHKPISPNMRRELVTIYASIARNTEQSPINSPAELESLASDADWQIRKQAVELIRHADLSPSSREQLLASLKTDPIPEVSGRAKEVLNQ